MKYIEDIAIFLRTLHQSSKFHALVISSAPGMAKSTTVESTLIKMGISFHSLGCYSTALELYNTFCTYPASTIVIDDAANIFNQPVPMAILKAATWSNAGSNGNRVIQWRSSSEKVVAPSVTFSGKIVLLTNAVPAGVETNAFLSRTLYLDIELSPEEIAYMLLSAAKEKEFYEDTELATRVANYLLKQSEWQDGSKLNLRTLQVAYELARINPENWPVLLDRLLPATLPRQLVRKLSASADTVEQQFGRFVKLTGMSRRTFFTYRQELGIRKNLTKMPRAPKKMQSALVDVDTLQLHENDTLGSRNETGQAS